MIASPKTNILKWNTWTDFHQVNSKKLTLNDSRWAAAQSVTAKLPPDVCDTL
jgi:hypothetical protein